MRNARSDDYWRHLDQIRNNSYVKQVDLKGYNKINKIEFSNRINIICGLNGAGKTTVLSAIKDLIGIELTKQDEIKLKKAKVEGEIFIDNISYSCENSESKRLADIASSYSVYVIEFFQILKFLDLLWNQENIEELLEQSEMVNFSSDDLNEINYLVGKDYSSLGVCEIEDFVDLGVIPYFTAKVGDVSYDSLNMGMGEYCLIYIYWTLMNMKDKSIIILEEPESFVSIKSQSSLMNLIAKFANKKKSSFIISTHSPFILDRVQDTDIKVISRAGGLVAINPACDNSAVHILGGEDKNRCVYFVEDDTAKIFLEILLRNNAPYLLRNSEIVIAGSSGAINKVMEACLWKYSVDCMYIGVYDDDQKEDILKKPNYIFATSLPPTKDVETEMKKICGYEDKIKKLASSLGYDLSHVVEQMARVNGEDHHDWLKDLSKYLSVSLNVLIEKLYTIWKEDNSESISAFIKSIESMNSVSSIEEAKQFHTRM